MIINEISGLPELFSLHTVDAKNDIILPTGDTMIERRKLERFDLKIPSRIAVIGQDKNKGMKLNVMTTNICANGAFFQTDRPLPTGTHVRIDLTLDRTEKDPTSRRAQLKASGAVVRSESEGMAICFDKTYKIIPIYET